MILYSDGDKIMFLPVHSEKGKHQNLCEDYIRCRSLSWNSTWVYSSSLSCTWPLEFHRYKISCWMGIQWGPQLLETSDLWCCPNLWYFSWDVVLFLLCHLAWGQNVSGISIWSSHHINYAKGQGNKGSEMVLNQLLRVSTIIMLKWVGKSQHGKVWSHRIHFKWTLARSQSSGWPPLQWILCNVRVKCVTTRGSSGLT